ncbi:acyltransferase family protein [Micromonospora chersina]|uniref:acyltransferase family protein n=1 Tax=Micromonospora chersina TaxID=47854 RepID=UPI00372106E0
MRHVRQLAERTPARRERYVDFLRALAISLVVVGHWTVTVVVYDNSGQLTGFSALSDVAWARPLTWIFMVIPVFFLVGGFANAASLTSSLARGDTVTDWLLDRSARLVRPTTVLLLTLAVGSLLGRLLGGQSAEIRTVVSFATIPLWFLTAYVAVVGLTPVMYPLHRRFGFVVPLVLVALVAAGDLGRLFGPGPLSGGNFLFGWLVIHQIGFAWYDAYALKDTPRPTVGDGRPGWLLTHRLPLGRPAAVPLLLVGLGALLLLTVVGPYPVSMITVPGERLDNTSPPSLALLALATLQLGVILLLHHPVERWLRRSRPWRAVIGVNAVVLTVFLWHLSAVVLLIGALNTVHWLPSPPVGTGSWWALRVPWLLTLTAILLALITVFGPIEARTGRTRHQDRERTGTGRSGTTRTVLTVAGYACVVAGLLVNSMVRMSAPEPLGLPPSALVAYLVGAGILRLLRSTRGHPGRPSR